MCSLHICFQTFQIYIETSYCFNQTSQLSVSSSKMSSMKDISNRMLTSLMYPGIGSETTDLKSNWGHGRAATGVGVSMVICLN